MKKIVEMIPEDLPDWALQAMEDGQLFNAMLNKINAQQAKIDALMLEFCPDEMTQDQRNRWMRQLCFLGIRTGHD